MSKVLFISQAAASKGREDFAKVVEFHLFLCFVDKASDVRSGSHGVLLVTHVNFFIPSQEF